MTIQRLMVIGICLFSFNNTTRTWGQESSEKQSIMQSVQSYVNAFNTRSAVGVSNHWATDGEFIDGTGEVIKGRPQIRKVFEKRFKEMPMNSRLSLTVKSISFVTDTVAIEDGIAEFSGELSEYSAVHKLEDKEWRVHSIRETPIDSQTPTSKKLSELEWLVGEWVDVNDDAVVLSSCRWSKNKNFLTCNVSVEVSGRDPVQGTQVIGYDPSKQKIRSWTFDSKGGIVEGIWTRKKNTWLVKTKHVLADGKLATATNVYELQNANQFTWKSSKRKLDGEALPDTKPITVVRLKGDSSQ